MTKLPKPPEPYSREDLFCVPIDRMANGDWLGWSCGGNPGRSDRLMRLEVIPPMASVLHNKLTGLTGW
jgi:hypothetical protein